MTIASQSRNAGPFTGTGSLVGYPFQFKVFSTADLLIQQTDTSNVTTNWTLGGDYSVVLNADQNTAPGGTITPVVALPAGYVLNVTSAVTQTQGASLTNAGGFFPKTIEDALDRLTVLIQQAFSSFRSTLRVPEVAGITALPAAAIRANSYLLFDALGNPTTSALGTINGQLATYVAPGVTQILTVPGQYASVSAALAAIAGWVIHGAVQIKVADGTYVAASSVTITHPFGSQIHIIGNITTPANCVLSFASSDGFYVPPGFQIGEIDGFRIIKTGTKANLGAGTDGGRYLKFGPHVEMDNFYYPCAIRNGGYMNAPGTPATSWLKITNSGDVGIWAFNGSYVNCDYADVSLGADVPNNLGGGIVAEEGSTIQATGVKCHGNFLCGLSALTNSAIRAWSAQLTGNQHGVITGSRGVVELFNQTGAPTVTTITGNTGYAHYCADSYGGVFGLTSATTTGNALGVERLGFSFSPVDGSTKVTSGSVTINANGPATVTGGPAYLDMDAPAGQYSIIRALMAGVEQARIQYNMAGGAWEFIAGVFTVMRQFAATGKVTIGRGAPATNSTNGHLQIPAQAGAPTGVVADVQTGFVPIVFDTTNSKLWVYNGTWKGVVLT